MSLSLCLLMLGNVMVAAKNFVKSIDSHHLTLLLNTSTVVDLSGGMSARANSSTVLTLVTPTTTWTVHIFCVRILCLMEKYTFPPKIIVL